MGLPNALASARTRSQLNRRSSRRISAARVRRVYSNGIRGRQYLWRTCRLNAWARRPPHSCSAYPGSPSKRYHEGCAAVEEQAKTELRHDERTSIRGDHRCTFSIVAAISSSTISTTVGFSRALRPRIILESIVGTRTRDLVIRESLVHDQRAIANPVDFSPDDKDYRRPGRTAPSRMEPPRIKDASRTRRLSSTAKAETTKTA
jgi:hypothetical protein